MLWNPILETGLPKIDEQHKELFRQVGVLMDRSQIDRIPATLDFLAKYVARHFSDEQALHATSKYPKAEAHKKLHADFVADYRVMRKNYEASGQSHNVVSGLSRMVLDWLKEHIMVHDKEFSVYYKNFKS